TATPYRTKTGLLTDDDGIFTDIAHEVPILELVKDGYLAPLISKSGHSHIETETLRVRAGEYALDDMESAFLSRVRSSVREIIAEGADRKSWLVFCSGVVHAQEITRELEANGIS